MEPAAGNTDTDVEQVLPPEIVNRIGTEAGFAAAAGLACSCRAYTGILRELVAREDILGPTLRATAGPHWLQWLVTHAKALRSRGVSEASLACLATKGADSLDDEPAVRLLGLAVQHDELRLFCGASAVTTVSLLQLRALHAAMLAAPRPQPEQVATPHLAALEWHYKQQLAAADLPYTVGAVASLLEAAVLQAQPMDIGKVLNEVCGGGQAVVLLPQLLTCNSFLAKLDSQGAYTAIQQVCFRGQNEVLRQLLACDAFLDQLPPWSIIRLILQQVGAGGQLEFLQQLLKCDALIQKLGAGGTHFILYVVCGGGGQAAPAPVAVLQQLLACNAFLAQVDSGGAFNAILHLCSPAQAEMLEMALACGAFMARLDAHNAYICLDLVCNRCQTEVLRQLLACGAFLAKLSTGNIRSVLEHVFVNGNTEILRQLLACNAFLERLSNEDARSVLEHGYVHCNPSVEQLLLACDAFRAKLGSA